MKYLAFILIITFSVPMYAWGAATEETDRDSLVAVTLKDGTKLQGTVIAESQESVTVRTIGGIEVTAPGRR